MNVPLKYHQMYADVSEISYATAGSACADVRAYFGVKERLFTVYKKDGATVTYVAFSEQGEPIHTVLEPLDRALIPTGIILDIPEGYSVRIHPRSGMAIKFGLTLCNCEGIIDSDYVQQLYIPVINLSGKNITISHNERIAQLELVQNIRASLMGGCPRPNLKTTREGGFGSTGVV